MKVTVLHCGGLDPQNLSRRTQYALDFMRTIHGDEVEIEYHDVTQAPAAAPLELIFDECAPSEWPR